MSDDLKNKVREKIPDDPTKTMGLYNVVSIAVGAKYDLTTNVNVTDGVINGAECVIEKIDYRINEMTLTQIVMSEVVVEWLCISNPIKILQLHHSGLTLTIYYVYLMIQFQPYI